MRPLSLFLPQVAGWFRTELGEPTPPQRLGWPVIASGAHSLVVAPTGSGKTLTAFLWAIDRLVREPVEGGVDVLYVSPLKALNADVERNLQRPVAGIGADVTIGVRSGDTPSSARQRMIRRPPQILITTPESLYLLLTSRAARETLRSVRTVIVDELHAVCGTKRGVHLALSLERLASLTRTDPQRIGLSATVRPLDAAARFLGGANRPVEVVDTGARRSMHLEVTGTQFETEAETTWDAITESLVADVRSHSSTLVFVNNRATAEKLVGRLNDAVAAEWDGDDELARAHHGSVAPVVRTQLEEALKAGRLPCLVATGTLELGIDMGAIDLVCQIESPHSVARGLQRVGRSGHLVDATAVGRIYPLYKTDLVETAALAAGMQAGEIEATVVQRNCLDVLAQQVIAEVAARDVSCDDLYALVRRAAPFRTLARAVFDAVVAMLAGEGADPDLSIGRPRVVWDRVAGELRTRPGAREVATQSGGTIPDRGLFPVYLVGAGVRLGELDEEFVFESKAGDAFALGSSVWRIVEIGRDRVLVTEAPGAVPRMPFWRGEGLGRPRSLGRAVGALLARLERLDAGRARVLLQDECSMDLAAAGALADLVAAQREACGVPTDRRVIVEAFSDEVGDWRICVHSVFGARTNQAWGLALAARVRERLGFDLEWTHGDDGILFRFPDLDGQPPAGLLGLVTSDRVRELVTGELAGSAMFAARFRENAQRALLLPRNRPGTRTPLWLQRLRAADLLQVVGRDPDFPIVVETYRECLEDLFDLDSLRELLAGIERGEVDVRQVTTGTASPFAAGMLWRFVFEYLYNGDAPKAEAQAASLAVSRSLLAELLGGDRVRELLDPEAVEEVTAQVTRAAPGWRAGDAEAVLDLLRRFGDLSPDELAARSEVDLDAVLAELGERVTRVGDRRVASDESERYVSLRRDADARAAWLRRTVLGRGIVTAEWIVQRYELEAGVVVGDLAGLADAGVLVRGEFGPGGTGEEWVGADTLQRMHRRTLALLRHRTKPVDAAAFARVVERIHAAVEGSGAAALDPVLDLLEGVPLPVELVDGVTLPLRLPGYQPAMLDAALSTGTWTWRMADARRVVFVRPQHAGLVRIEAAAEPTTVAADAMAFLERGGGWRTGELAGALGAPEAEVREALGALVSAGRVTNDTFVARGVGGHVGHGVEGRWSAARTAPPGWDDADFVAGILLRRYGVVSREAWAAESWRAGWQEVRGALARAEARGDVRRGYFVEGLSGAQYAAPWVVEALRAPIPDGVVAVALPATDAANPWGSLLESRGVRRSAGAVVVLEHGAPVLAWEGTRVTPLSDRPAAAYGGGLEALGKLLRRRHYARKRPHAEAWGREERIPADVGRAFSAAGWVRTPKGYAPHPS